MINYKQFTKVGIVGVGGYVPKYRLKVEEVAKSRGKDGKKIGGSLGVEQKAVADKDEDTVSLAVEAGRRALERAGLRASKLGAVLVGSESHPYAVKPTGSMVAEILGVGNEYITADLEFACKAGTTGMAMIAGMIEAGMIDLGLAIGADVAQSQPGDALEFTAAAGAAGVILGNKKHSWLAELNYYGSFNSDTPDFWRREGEKYPKHAGRFTGEPAYFKHVVEGARRFLRKTKEKIGEFDQVILHMPNGKFPKRAGQRLGVEGEKMEKGFLVREMGNPYSASAMLGLVRVVEEGKRGEKILMTSYGSGAGSDSFSMKIKKKIDEKKGDLAGQLAKVERISYAEYLKLVRERNL